VRESLQKLTFGGWDFKAESVVERERASELQNAPSAFGCALCVKIPYELGGRGYKGVFSSVVVHLLAFVGFQFLEREIERTSAQEACIYIRH
jgi:hypothetical protein